MTDLTFKPAWALSLPELADLFTRAFTGYIAGSVIMTPSVLASMVAQGGIDLNLSRLVCRQDDAVGFGLIARQGWISRVAAMGITPGSQGRQVGSALLTHLIEQAQSRGDHEVELEVFEQNERAVRLYEKYGFSSLRKLLSYSLGAPEGLEAPELMQVDVVEAAHQVMGHGANDLPWQASGSHLIRMAAPFAAYRLGDAFAIISDPTAATIVIRAVLVAPEARGRGQGRRLLSAMAAAFPGKQWFVPALCPEDFGEFFERCGFERQELYQLQMRLELGSSLN